MFNAKPEWKPEYEPRSYNILYVHTNIIISCTVNIGKLRENHNNTIRRAFFIVNAHSQLHLS